jgi:Clp amino terminal domain, pathogenicity island component
MSDFPISLDNLISYVRSLHGKNAPLDNLTDAVQVASSLDEQSDALIGYFVDQARRAGASWSDIGASMGVSKQAVQKRFVAKVEVEVDDIEAGPQPLFSRFTDRARHVVSNARSTAALAGATNTSTNHLAAALLSEPAGIASRVIHDAGITDAQLLAAFELKLADDSTPPPVQGEVPFDELGKTALREALKAALRLGHNYIGTEHILLGVLRQKGDAAKTLESLGLAQASTEAAVTEAIEKMKSQIAPDTVDGVS